MTVLELQISCCFALSKSDPKEFMNDISFQRHQKIYSSVRVHSYMKWKFISSIIRNKRGGHLYFSFTWVDFYSETCCLVLKGDQTSWWTDSLFSSYRWCPCSCRPIWSSDCNGQTHCSWQFVHCEQIWDPRRVSEALLELRPLSKSREPSQGKSPRHENVCWSWLENCKH